MTRWPRVWWCMRSHGRAAARAQSPPRRYAGGAGPAVGQGVPAHRPGTCRPAGACPAAGVLPQVLANARERLAYLEEQDRRNGVALEPDGAAAFAEFSSAPATAAPRLSLSAVRRQLDDVYDKLKDSVQNDLNDLWAADRFQLPQQSGAAIA